MLSSSVMLPELCVNDTCLKLGVIPSSNWVFSHRKFPQTQRTEVHSTIDQQTLYIISLALLIWLKPILIQFGVGFFYILAVKHKWACLKVSVILCFMTNYQYFGPHRWKRGKYLRRSPRGYRSWPARYEVACLALRRPNKSSQSPYSYEKWYKTPMQLCSVLVLNTEIWKVSFSAGSTSAGVLKAAQARWCPLSTLNEDMVWL